jgi:hypothetical protein
MCRVCPLVHKRVLWGSESVAKRSVGLMLMALFCVVYHAAPLEFVIAVGIRASMGVSSTNSGALSE